MPRLLSCLQWLVKDVDKEKCTWHKTDMSKTKTKGKVNDGLDTTAMVRRALANGDTQSTAARNLGITRQGVFYHAQKIRAEEKVAKRKSKRAKK